MMKFGFNVFSIMEFLQVTFSEKETNSLTKLTYLAKNFEILHFSDNISKITMIPIYFCSEKCNTCKGKLHYGIDSIVKFQGFKIFGCEFGE